jgi:putative transposase
MHRLSRFAKLMKGLPRDRFQALTDQHAGDRYVKRFGCWQQLLAMVYAQVAGLSSLREVETGFNQHRNHHYHLGAQPLRRSTLADANESRNPKVFEETLKLLIGSAGAKIRSDRRELLYLIDSTTIPLYGRGLQWAQATATRTRGLKVHIQLEGSALVPVHFLITAANVNDATVGSQIVPEPGATYVFDKGYCDYKWWERIALASARFVTRLKKNAAIEVLKIQQIPGDESQLVSDCVIRLSKKGNRGGHTNACRRRLRRIEVFRPEHNDNIVLVTNDLDAPASEIAALYKQRWDIELFFKWIKQHLKIKKFMGENENAIRIQILTALIAYVLVVLAKIRDKLTGSLWQILAELRTGLFLRDQEEQDRWRRRRKTQAISHALQPSLL